MVAFWCSGLNTELRKILQKGNLELRLLTRYKINHHTNLC
jgi:hypothetical protein